MKNRQYFLGPLISYFTIFFNIAAGLLYTPWMVNQIGKSNYAVYTLSVSFISIFLVDFGLSAAVSRFMAKYRAEGNEEKANAFTEAVARLYLIIDGCIFAVLLGVYFFLPQIYKGLTAAELETYKTLYVIVASTSIITFPFTPLSGIILAYERIIELKLCDLLNKVITIVLVVIALLNDFGVVVVVTANAVSGLIIVAVKYMLVLRTTPVRLRRMPFDTSLFKEIFFFSIWTTVMSISQRCIFNLAPTFLGYFSNSDEIALFAPASTLEGYFYSIAAAVNGIFIAKISKYIADNEEKRINALMLSIGKYQLVIMGLVVVGFACLGNEFMHLWMGKDFIGAYRCAIILFLPDMLLFTQQIAKTTAIAKNYVKEIAIGYIGMAIVAIGVSSLLCSRLGAFGSSIAIAAAYLFLIVYLDIFVYYRKLKLNMREFFRECYGRLLPPIAAALVIGYFVCNIALNSYSGWGGLILKGSVVTAIYAAIVFSFGLTAGEKSKLLSVAGKLGR